MTNEMVPTLAPHVNVLATIMGATLDFFNLVVGGCLSPLALCAPLAVVIGITGPLPRPGEPFGEEVSARGGVGTLLSSVGGGVGALSSSSATLLGGGVLAAYSSPSGVPALVFAGAGCSSAVSAPTTSMGHPSVPSWVVYGAASSTTTTGSAVFWPAMLSGSTSDATLTKIWYFINVKSCSNKRKNNNNDRRKCQGKVVLLIDRSAYASL